MQTIKAERLARDLETMMNVVNSDPGHIARAKAKAARVERSRRRSAAKVNADASLSAAVGICTGTVGLLALALAALI